mmetsp:Transcript_33072/g.73105  ORF Transcript_33072/g.73105 Transcript_33072/m.73105 type:complete len:299 (+) Transcript_33072:1022-1918(+)
MEDVWQLVNHPHGNAYGVVLEGQLLLKLHQHTVLHDDRDAAARGRHLEPAPPAPARRCQAEDAVCQVLPVGAVCVVVQDSETSDVVEHAVHHLPGSEAIPRIAPGFSLGVGLVGIKVNLAAVEQQRGPVPPFELVVVVHGLELVCELLVGVWLVAGWGDHNILPRLVTRVDRALEDGCFCRHHFPVTLRPPYGKEVTLSVDHGHGLAGDQAPKVVQEDGFSQYRCLVPTPPKVRGDHEDVICPLPLIPPRPDFLQLLHHLVRVACRPVHPHIHKEEVRFVCVVGPVRAFPKQLWKQLV